MPRILVLTANGKTTPLQLAAELRNIRESLGEGSNFTVLHQSEARAEDLIRRLVSERPDILHFAGHGMGGLDQAISLVGDSGHEVVLTKKDLTTIFKNIPTRPRLVVLNACSSAEVSGELKNWVGVVIGANGRIGDDAARRFAARLYAGLGQSCSVNAAFELARIELKVNGYDSNQLVIDYLPANTPQKLVFYARPEMMARFELSKRGTPKVTDGTYSLHLWMRGVDQTVDCVTFQICHDSFKRKDRFWEVNRAESNTFWTDDFRTYGDVTVRATAWSRDRGVGTVTSISSALRRHYGQHPKAHIAEAMMRIENA
jgi:hypothetical protein